MAVVKVNVSKITDMSQPIFVEFGLTDSKEISHYFIDKAPVVCDNHDSVLPVLPCGGSMKCKIIKEKADTVIIDTSEPWDIESLNGEYKFEVYKKQVII